MVWKAWKTRKLVLTGRIKIAKFIEFAIRSEIELWCKNFCSEKSSLLLFSIFFTQCSKSLYEIIGNYCGTRGTSLWTCANLWSPLKRLQEGWGTSPTGGEVGRRRKGGRRQRDRPLGGTENTKTGNFQKRQTLTDLTQPQHSKAFTATTTTTPPGKGETQEPHPPVSLRRVDHRRREFFFGLPLLSYYRCLCLCSTCWSLDQKSQRPQRSLQGAGRCAGRGDYHNEARYAM